MDLKNKGASKATTTICPDFNAVAYPGFGAFCIAVKSKKLAIKANAAATSKKAKATHESFVDCFVDTFHITKPRKVRPNKKRLSTKGGTPRESTFLIAKTIPPKHNAAVIPYTNQSSVIQLFRDLLYISVSMVIFINKYLFYSFMTQSKLDTLMIDIGGLTSSTLTMRHNLEDLDASAQIEYKQELFDSALTNPILDEKALARADKTAQLLKQGDAEYTIINGRYGAIVYDQPNGLHTVVGWVPMGHEGIAHDDLLEERLKASGVGSEQILRQPFSRDTVASAICAKILHLEPNDWKHNAVITNNLHSYRILQIFDHILGDDYVTTCFGVQTSWDSAPNAIASEQKNTVDAFFNANLGKTPKGDSQAIESWLFSSHGLYNNERSNIENIDILGMWEGIKSQYNVR